MFRHNITPRANYPLVTYETTPLGECGARPDSTGGLGRDRLGLATTTSAISIATLALTAGSFHVGYPGFTSAEQRSAVHYEVATGETMAGSPVVETFAVDTSSDHQSLSRSADVPLLSEQPSGQLTTAVMFDDFDELGTRYAGIDEFLKKNQTSTKSESQAVAPQIAMDTTDVIVVRGVKHTLPLANRNNNELVNTDRSAFSGSKLDNASIIEDQATLIDDDIRSKLENKTSRLHPSLSKAELSTFTPLVAEMNAMDAELGETEWETKMYGPEAGHQDNRSFPAPKQLAETVDALKIPAASTPRKVREREGNAHREIGAAIANLKIRLGDQPTSGLPPSETQTRSGRAFEPVSMQVQSAMSATGKNISSLAVMVSDGELVSVRLNEIISLFETKMDRPLFVWLKSSSNADKFVTPELLRRSGIAVDYDRATEQLILSIEK